MTLSKSIKNMWEQFKYGSLTHTAKFPSVINGSFYHVAGPVDDSDEILLRNHDVSDLVLDPSFIWDDGKISIKSDYSDEREAKLAETFRAIGQAYLGGRFDIDRVTPINGDVFMLPLDRQEVNRVLSSLENLEGLTISGSMKRPHQLQAGPTPQDNLGLAQQYVKDLLFWQIPFFDYSDHVKIVMAERTKEAKNGVRKNFVFDRDFSSANAGGPIGLHKVVGLGNERVVVSGYEK